MSSRRDFFFRQRVTEAELDDAFALLEQADHDLASDLGIYGLISGAVAVPHEPVADLTIDLTAPGRAYDRLGRRVFLAAGQRVDLERDSSGLPTEIVQAGQERWVSVYFRFSRLLSDPRVDGAGVTVMFRRDESYEVVVRMGVSTSLGNAPRPLLEPDELLVCDVHRRFDQNQILAADIDTSRRQVFVFAPAESVGVQDNGWNVLEPSAPNVQAALDDVDELLRQHLQGGLHHAANAINYTPHGFVSATNVQGAINELIDDLQSPTAGFAGALRVGADAEPGTPFSLSSGNVDAQLSQLLGHVNGHANSATAHAANTISAVAHAYISSTTVQAQLQEIVTTLAAKANGQSGAERIGAEAVTGTGSSLAVGTVRDQLGQLLGYINQHTGPGGHKAQAIGVEDGGNRLAANDVEAALAEVLQSLEGDHFRQNETNGGQHRVIRQPALGSGRVLVWDARGTGNTFARLRVYLDDNGVWFVFNAAWDQANGQWVRDGVSGSGALRLSRNQLELVHHNETGSNTFTTWLRSWVLPMSSATNSGFEVSGTIQEVGRCSLEGVNTNASQALVAMGASVTFRARFAAAPSSITLTTLASTNFAGLPTTMNVDRDGFHFNSTQTLQGNQNARWVGKYTATA